MIANWLEVFIPERDAYLIKEFVRITLHGWAPCRNNKMRPTDIPTMSH